MPANKVRRRGPHAPLSAHYYKDDAIMRAGEKAEVLFTRGLAFQSEVIRDGIITDAQLDLIGVGLTNVRGRAKKLAEVGLWERVENGYNIRSWLGWNWSRDEIMSYAEKDNARKKPRGGDPDPTPPEPPPTNGHPSDSARNVDGIPDGSDAGFRAESEGLARGGARASSRSPSTSRSKSRSAAARSGATDQTAHPERATGRRSAALVDAVAPPGLADRDRGQLAHHAATALDVGAPPSAVTAGLEAWMTRDGCTPALLPSLISDAVKREHGATAPGDPARSKARRWADIAEQLDAEAAAADPANVVHFPASRTAP